MSLDLLSTELRKPESEGTTVNGESQ
jgi:hypothetical protein